MRGTAMRNGCAGSGRGCIERAAGLISACGEDSKYCWGTSSGRDSRIRGFHRHLQVHGVVHVVPQLQRHVVAQLLSKTQACLVAVRVFVIRSHAVADRGAWCCGVDADRSKVRSTQMPEWQFAGGYPQPPELRDPWIGLAQDLQYLIDVPAAAIQQ